MRRGSLRPTITLAVLSYWLISCSSQCNDFECVIPGECHGSYAHQPIKVVSGMYQISETYIVDDQCQSERRNSDWNSFHASVVLDDSTSQMSVSVSNGITIGHGQRNQSPFCNSANLEADALPENAAGCTWSAGRSTYITINPTGELSVTVSELRKALRGSCGTAAEQCALLFALNLRALQ